MKSFLEFNSNKITLYHGTCPHSATKLIKYGWKPNSGNRGNNLGNAKFLYVSTSLDDALWYANEKGCNIGLSIVVSKTDIRVDPEDGTYDTIEQELSGGRFQLPGKFIIINPINAKQIKVVHGTLSS